MIITIFIFTATIIIIIITMMMKIKNPVLADERPTVVPLCSTGHKIPVTAFLLFSFFHLHKILIYQEIQFFCVAEYYTLCSFNRPMGTTSHPDQTYQTN